MSVDTNTILLGIGTVVGAVQLGVVLKIMLNDLHEIRTLLIEHLRDHARK